MFVVPGDGRLTDEDRAIELARLDGLNLAGFHHGQASYFLVGRAGTQELTRMAEDLMASGLAGPVARADGFAWAGR